MFCRTKGVSLSALESSLNFTECVLEFSRASQSSLSDSSRFSKEREKQSISERNFLLKLYFA